MANSTKSKQTMINDIVHGMITLSDQVKEVIDTPEFQRLRFISQIGLTAYVNPSASYSRFEHSLGTFYLASKLIRRLDKQLGKQLGKKKKHLLTSNDIKCIELAALCHDLGHGPHSHFWENAFDLSLNIKPRKHEDISVEIFLDLIEQKKSPSAKSIKSKLGLSEKMIDLIGRIITGKYEKEKDGHKRFLFQIVANKESGLDVDKLDYLCRDSFYLGWSNNKIHDFKRLIYFFRVIKDENNDWHLAMKDREIFNVHEVFSFRHIVHRYGCQHRVVKSIECMFRNAIKSIIENKMARKKFVELVIGKTIKYEPGIWFAKRFISKVNDYHLRHIIKKHARKIYENIEKRNLYKLVHQIQIKYKLRNSLNSLPKEFNEKINELQNHLQLSNKSNVSLSLPIYSLQTENKGDPLTLMMFYSKKFPNKCLKYTKDSLPDSIKLRDDEIILMVFSDKDLNKKSKNILKALTQKNYRSKVDIINDLKKKYIFTEVNY